MEFLEEKNQPDPRYMVGKWNILKEKQKKTKNKNKNKKTNKNKQTNKKHKNNNNNNNKTKTKTTTKQSKKIRKPHSLVRQNNHPP